MMVIVNHVHEKGNRANGTIYFENFVVSFVWFKKIKIGSNLLLVVQKGMLEYKSKY